MKSGRQRLGTWASMFPSFTKQEGWQKIHSWFCYHRILSKNGQKERKLSERNRKNQPRSSFAYICAPFLNMPGCVYTCLYLLSVCVCIFPCLLARQRMSVAMPVFAMIQLIVKIFVSQSFICIIFQSGLYLFICIYCLKITLKSALHLLPTTLSSNIPMNQKMP